MQGDSLVSGGEASYLQVQAKRVFMETTLYVKTVGLPHPRLTVTSLQSIMTSPTSCCVCLASAARLRQPSSTAAFIWYLLPMPTLVAAYNCETRERAYVVKYIARHWLRDTLM